MSDVNFTFGMVDQVSPVLRRQQAEAGNLQKTLKEVGQSASKAGGPLGGLAGRVLGGAGGPFAGLALAATGFTLALTAMNAVQDKAIANAKEQVTWQERLNKALDAGGKNRAGTAAGGLSQADATKLLLTRGGTTDDAKENQKRAGTSLEDALRGTAGLALIADPAKRATLRDQAAQLAQTGEISFTDAVKRLTAHIGSVDLRRELVSIRGLRPTQENVDSAGAAFERAQGRGEYQLRQPIANIRKAVNAGQLVGLAQNDDLTSGATANAIADQARDALNPAAKALQDLRDEVEAGARQMEAAARSQLKQSAQLATLGKKLFGGEGSEQDKLTNYRHNTRVVTQ